MNAEFLSNRHQVLTYELKAPTKSSFYQKEGPKGVLPERIGLNPFNGKPTGRFALYQIEGRYKIQENGLYFNMNQRIVHTKIMTIPNYPLFIGWGEIDERFGIYDLLIISSDNQCKHSFQIHHFKGLAKPMYLMEVCTYLQQYLKDQ